MMATHYFFGINMTHPMFFELQQRWLPFYDYRRVYHRSDFHLTLQFLGALTEDEVGAVIETAQTTSEQTAPFTLQFGNMLHFGHVDHPRVWGVEPHPSVELTTLQSKLRASLIDEFPRLDRKAFVPHVTLAKKWGNGERIPYESPVFSFEEEVSEITLYEVMPNHTPSYREVATFPLIDRDAWRKRIQHKR